MKYILWFFGLVMLIGGNTDFIIYKYFPLNLPFVFIGGMLTGWMIGYCVVNAKKYGINPAGEKKERRDMRDEKVIGDVQFWNSCIVHYRNEGNKAKSLKKRVEYAKCLCECRHWLKYAEKRILQKVLIVLVLLSIFLQGCQTMEGIRADIHKLTEPPRQVKE